MDSVPKNTTPLINHTTGETKRDIVKVPTSSGQSRSVIKIRDIILTILLVSVALILISTIMTIRSLRKKTIPGTGNMMAAKAYYLQNYIEDNTNTSAHTTKMVQLKCW